MHIPDDSEVGANIFFLEKAGQSLPAVTVVSGGYAAWREKYTTSGRNAPPDQAGAGCAVAWAQGAVGEYGPGGPEVGVECGARRRELRGATQRGGPDHQGPRARVPAGERRTVTDPLDIVLHSYGHPCAQHFLYL